MNGKIKRLKDNQGNYLFPITLSDAVFVDETTTLSQWFDNLKKQTGGSFGSYYLELDRWQITINPTNLSDKTIAQQTSQHLNGALLWASKNGYKELVLPRGIYLIDETNPVQPQSYMTLDLNGSTLRIRDNDQPGYVVVDFNNGQQFSRITNGKLVGDRYSHNYAAPGNHENGEGITVSNGKFISLDNLEVTGFIGDGIGTNSQSTQDIYLDGGWEQGSINSTGALIADSTKIRWASKIQLNTDATVMKELFVGLYGDGYGGFGSGVTAYLGDIYFYDIHDNFLAAETNVQFFDLVEIPMTPYYSADTNYARVVLHQSIIPATGTSSVMFGAEIHASYVYIEKCHIHHCRRCGLTPCGQHIYVSNNHVHHINSNGNPGGGPFACIDIEDGYGFNQYIYITGNKFEESPIGVSLVGPRNVVIDNNRFYNTGSNTVWVYARMISYTNNVIYNSQPSGFDLQGEVEFLGNRMYNAMIKLSANKHKVIADNYFHNSQLNVGLDLPFIAKIDGNTFFSDSDSTATLTAAINLHTNPQHISNCSLLGSARLTPDSSNGWIIENLFSSVQGAIQVPLGKIINCNFSGGFDLTANPASTVNGYNFISCTFEWSYTQTNALMAPYLVPYNGISIKFKDCIINNFSNDNQPIMVFSNLFIDHLELVNCLINIKNATDTKSIFALTGPNRINLILLKENHFKADNNHVELFSINTYYAHQQQAPRLIMENNRFESININVPGYFYDNHLVNNSVDNAIDPYNTVEALPTSGYYSQGSRLYNSAPASGGYVGWVCTTAGYLDSVLVWTASTNYTFLNGLIFQGGHYYLIQNLGTSTGTMPAFPTTSGATVNDSAGTTTWKGNTAYRVGDLVVPTTSNGYYYRCTIAGTSDNSNPPNEPAWKTSGTITDGSVTWTPYQMVVWKEVGVPAVFKTFGLISQ